MSTILLAWELGAGLGHLARLRPVAEALLMAGHRVHLAVRPMPPVRACLAELRRTHPGRVTASAAPVPPSPPLPPSLPMTRTLADPLALLGFGDPARLATAAAGWRSLLDQVHPSLVVADFSPTLGLVARGREPLVVVGNGYTIPPAGRCRRSAPGCRHDRPAAGKPRQGSSPLSSR